MQRREGRRVEPWYDPQTARFVQVDPVFQSPADSQTLNAYGYVGNDPVNRIDPDGRQWEGGSGIKKWRQPLPFTWSGGGRDKGYPRTFQPPPAAFIAALQAAQPQQVGQVQRVGGTAGQGGAGWRGDLPEYNVLLDSISGSPLNDDGHLTLSEANYQFRHGGGQPVTADLARIDFSNLSEGDFGGIGSSRYLSPAYPDRLVYGNLRLTLGPEQTVTSRYDVYDFDIQGFQGSWTSRAGLALNARTLGRNALTVLGSGVAGSGTPYRINFVGMGRIRPRP